MILSLVKVAVFLFTLLCVSRSNDLPNTQQLIKKKKGGVCDIRDTAWACQMWQWFLGTSVRRKGKSSSNCNWVIQHLSCCSYVAGIECSCAEGWRNPQRSSFQLWKAAILKMNESYILWFLKVIKLLGKTGCQKCFLFQSFDWVGW